MGWIIRTGWYQWRRISSFSKGSIPAMITSGRNRDSLNEPKIRLMSKIRCWDEIIQSVYIGSWVSDFLRVVDVPQKRLALVELLPESIRRRNGETALILKPIRSENTYLLTLVFTRLTTSALSTRLIKWLAVVRILTRTFSFHIYSFLQLWTN